jgi:hypothetical protein
VARQATDTLTTAITTASNTLLTDTTPTPTLPNQNTLTSSTSLASETLNGPPSGPPNNGGGGGGGGGNNNGGSNSSPLLFFVALGFGVVFTNLWIIVGVKYCFRYNARSRQMRMNEDGEPINMENMPRPHRRRREKKLMTMDEVNEKFPMLKYKNWVASRAQEGLPTRGGVSAPPSRPGSLRDADGVVPELPSKERMSTEERPTTSATGAATEKQTPKHVTKESTSSTAPAAPRTSTDAHLVPTISESAILSKDPNRASQDDDDDEDEHIDAALPPECMGTSGDTCAICIDTLEDDDDVRGLTCGHAFHAVCLDPWLTSRRACCPLCKADYYTPKPRPPAPEGGETPTHGVITVTLPSERRMNLPNRPPRTFLSVGRYGGRPVASHFPSADQSSYGNRTERQSRGDGGRGGFLDRFRRQPSAPVSPTSAPTLSPTRSAQAQPPSQPQLGGMFSNFRAAFPAFRMGAVRRNDPNVMASGANPAVTPSNLEAGVRS